MIKETLILLSVGGEFGRAPYSDSGIGRDHNHKGYSMGMVAAAKSTATNVMQRSQPHSQPLTQQLVLHLAVHVGQAEVAAAVAECEAFVVQAH